MQFIRVAPYNNTGKYKESLMARIGRETEVWRGQILCWSALREWQSLPLLATV